MLNHNHTKLKCSILEIPEKHCKACILITIIRRRTNGCETKGIKIIRTTYEKLFPLALNKFNVLMANTKPVSEAH